MASSLAKYSDKICAQPMAIPSTESQIGKELHFSAHSASRR